MEDTINQEGQVASDAKDVLDVLPDDSELVTKINSWLAESKDFYTTLYEAQKKSEDYYLGKQTKRDQVPNHLSNFVQNRIFESVETILPIITSKPAEFIVKSPDVSELGPMKARKVQMELSDLYDRLQISQKLEDASRSALNYRFGVLKAEWDTNTDKPNLKFVRSQRIRIPNYGGRFVKGLPYLIEKIDMDFQEIKDFFGEATANELASMSKPEGGAEEDMPVNKRVWTINEVWTDWWRCWKYENKILKKEKNPYWNFDDVTKNHLDKPAKPYFLIAPFSLGKSPIPETSLVEQAIPIQDGLNVVSRIIINHATKTGNGAWLVDSNTMTKEEADQIRNEPGIIIYGNGVANPNNVRRDSPPPLPAYLAQLWDSLNATLDNLFGVHSTTRGERQGKETARGRILLKNADLGRLDYIVREIDRAVQDVGNYFVQMMKMYYTDARKLKYSGAAQGVDDMESDTISNEDVEDGVEIFVTAGSTLPKDEVSEADQALRLWELGAIDPISLYEKLLFKNPEQSAERLMKWKMGTLIPSAVPAPAGAPVGGGSEVVPSPLAGILPTGGQ